MNKWPFFEEDEIQAVTKTLQSGKVNYWTGTECQLFEKEYAQFVGSTYAISLANGTVALEAALYALGIGKGDEVITTCRTFIATASCIIRVGAIPVLADVDLDSQNITSMAIEPLITSNTKAIIAVHLAGWPCEMDSIMELARKNKLYVIEDCAQAHGATYKHKQVGSWGDISAFSFCQDKIITTGGEGGMVTMNAPLLWEKIWSFKDHGKNYHTVFNQPHLIGFKWLHDAFGTNWRMTEMQATIGRLQLKKLPHWVRLRQRNAKILNEVFFQQPALRVTLPPPEVSHAYYKYYVFLRPERLKANWNRVAIMQALKEENITCFVGSCSDISGENAFKQLPYWKKSDRPNAQILGETSLMFLVHPTLSEADMYHTAEKVIKVMKLATQ